MEYIFAFFAMLGDSVLGVMNRTMFRWRNYLKVFYAIVEFIMVDVMNNLIRGKFSAKMLFHYKTMFSMMYFTHAKHPIPFRINPSTLSALPRLMPFSADIFPMTFMRTKSKSIIWKINKLFAVKAVSCIKNSVTTLRGVANDLLEIHASIIQINND